MALTKVTMTGASKENIKEGFTKLNDIIDDLASTATGKGASCIGIYDTAGNYTAANVETALAEVYTDHSASLAMSTIFDENSATTTGLTWGYKGGLFRNDNTITTVAAGTVSLTDDTTNYIEVGTDGTVYVVASAFTSGRIPIRTVVTASGVQGTSTDKRAWFSTWPSAQPALVDKLKVTVNATVNILDLFEKTTGADPTATYPIKVAIPDGTGVTWRTRSAAVKAGTGSFTLADATGYWGYADLAGSAYQLYVYAIWSTADSGLVWGLSNRSNLAVCPAGTTATVDGFMLLEDSSTYTRVATDYCVAVGTVKVQYDTGDTPDYTFSAYNIRTAYGPQPSLPAGHISGLAMSNNGVDAEHDLNIAVGSCRDTTNSEDMVLASAFVKQGDATWAVGTAAGGFATGETIPATGTVHVWLIKRSDTGVVDILMNNDATTGLTPTLPTGYDYKRLIGSWRTASSHFINGDWWGTGGDRTFMFDTPILDVSSATPGTAAVTAALSTPGGIIVAALVNVTVDTSTAYLSSFANADLAPSATLAPLATVVGSNPGSNPARIFTNTSAQIRYRRGADAAIYIATLGWEQTL